MAICLMATVTHAAEAASSPSEANKSRSPDILVQGRLFCSIKRPVIFPFHGIVAKIETRPGLPIKKGTALIRCQLLPDAIQQIRRRLFPPQIAELKNRMAAVDKDMAALDIRFREISKLALEKMAPQQALQNLEIEKKLLERYRGAVEEQLAFETQAADEDLALLAEQLGQPLRREKIPAEAVMRAPITGHVLGIPSEVQEGAELEPGTPLLVVGVLDPILMTAQVHEMEAVQIVTGDRAEITLESIPERVFLGTVERLSWLSSTTGVEQPSYFEMQLSLPNHDLALIDGMKGEIAFRQRRQGVKP